MKKFIILISLIIFTKILSNRISLSSNRVNQSTVMGEFKLPTKDISADLCVYFNGNFIQVDDGSFIFRSTSSKIYILVTDSQNVLIKTEENKLATLTLKEGALYYFYLLSKKFSGAECTWDVKSVELPVFKNQKIIPLDTLIVPLSVNFVESELENRSFKVNSATVKLPTIILKGEAHAIKQEVLRSCMALADFKPFHSKQRTTEVKGDNLRVSMIVDQ